MKKDASAQLPLPLFNKQQPQQRRFPQTRPNLRALEDAPAEHVQESTDPVEETMDEEEHCYYMEEEHEHYEEEEEVQDF